MLPYYFNLALRSFRRHKILTALMVCAIALGIGASMTTLTVFYVLSGDPIPQKSDRLHYVQLDPGEIDGWVPGDEPAKQMTRYDAEALVTAAKAKRQALMSGGDVPIVPDRAGLSPFYAGARYTSADFFAMFDVPFAEGGGWNAEQDKARARVVVLAAELAAKLYQGESAIGRTLRIAETDFRVVGVLERWRPKPHFYDLNTGSYGKAEQVFMPFSTHIELEYGHNGSMSCWGNTGNDQKSLNASCVWIQMWVELEKASDADAYRDFLVAYSEQQKAAGRFERPPNVRLRNVMAWLDFNKVVPSDVRLQMWLAFGFLLVCLLNTIGLLLAKFMRQGTEIGVRRALGASRGSVFVQLLVEAATIGIVGAAVGLLLVLGGLWAVRQQPTSYADLIHLNLPMLGVTVALAIAASVFAAILPAWRAAFISPAAQVKTQ